MLSWLAGGIGPEPLGTRAELGAPGDRGTQPGTALSADLCSWAASVATRWEKGAMLACAVVAGKGREGAGIASETWRGVVA